MARTTVDLSPKAMSFLVDALQHYQKHLERRSEEVGISEDELADLANDRQYLLALRQDLQRRHDELLRCREVVPSRS